LSHRRPAGLDTDQKRVRHPLPLERFHEEARRHSVRAEPGEAEIRGVEDPHLARPAVEVHRVDERDGVRSLPQNGGEEALEGRAGIEDRCAEPVAEPPREDGAGSVVGPELVPCPDKEDLSPERPSELPLKAFEGCRPQRTAPSPTGPASSPFGIWGRGS